MIRLSRLSDYAIVLLTALAASPEGRVRTARSLAAESRIPLPTVSKILKALARAGLLASHRGVAGGFALARPASEISVGDAISAIEGPIALTECLGTTPGSCEHEPLCPVRSNWGRINRTVADALAGLSIAEMARPAFVFSLGAPRAAKGVS